MESKNETFSILNGTCVNGSIPKAAIYQGIHLINRKYILPAELILGIAGNVIFLITLFKFEKKLHSSKLNLVAMAFSDALFLLMHMPQLFVVYDFARTSYQFMHFFVLTLPSQIMLLNTFYTASVW